MLAPFCASSASYSSRIASSWPSSDAAASFARPCRAMTRSSSSPNRMASLSRHSCAADASPTRRHATVRFSYVVQTSAVSAADTRLRSGEAEKARGLLRRISGARRASARASAGERSPWGRSGKDAMVLGGRGLAGASRAVGGGCAGGQETSAAAVEPPNTSPWSSDGHARQPEGELAQVWSQC